MNFKRYVLPSFLILLVAGGIGLAQNINKALQLSQDNTGAFGVDSNNGVYFPGHMLFTGNGRPAPTISGTATPSLIGTDMSGQITMGTSATTAIMTFGQAFLSTPNCSVVSQNITPVTYSMSLTAITITQSSQTGNKLSYWCPSQN